MSNIKYDPLSYLLLVGILVLQVYSTFLSNKEASEFLDSNDSTYQDAVFDSVENKGIMHQVFRQNEVDRELLKEILARCGR